MEGDVNRKTFNSNLEKKNDGKESLIWESIESSKKTLVALWRIPKRYNLPQYEPKTKIHYT